MSSSHDFVTVDLRGFKAPLVQRALATQTTISSIVRGAVAHELDLATDTSRPCQTIDAGGDRVRISIRLSGTQADRLVAAARTAGLPRGVYLAGLIDGVPVLLDGPKWQAYWTALVTSNSRLSTISRNLAHLTSLLREGAIRPALEYATTLDAVTDDVRAHLDLAAAMLRGLSNDAGPRLQRTGKKKREAHDPR